MNARIPGVNVPTWVIQRLNEAGIADRRKVGAEIAGEIAAAVLPHCQGLHIMAQGGADLLPEILSGAGVRDG